MPPIRIELVWLANDGDEEPLGLVVPHPTGVVYTQQAGGTACCHPETEGFYVPLPRYFAPAEWLRGHWPGSYKAEIAASLIASCETLKEFFRPLTRKEQVEHTALCGEFGEAWVPMMVELPAVDDGSEARELLKPLDGRLVILTYPNSD